MVERENQPLQVVLWPLSAQISWYTLSLSSYNINKYKNKQNTLLIIKKYFQDIASNFLKLSMLYSSNKQTAICGSDRPSVNFLKSKKAISIRK